MKVKRYYPKIFVSLIFTLGLFLRIYKLQTIPAGLYLDEAAQGYNAYSILKTGKDEFGNTLPILFRSFNDFKTPVYTYLTIPFIYFFGLNVLSVRFLSSISGSLTILFAYLLLKTFKLPKDFKNLPLIAALLISISPWHILLSRGAFEVNLSLFFLVSGLYSFYLGLKRPKFLILSSFLFGFCITSYHAQRFIVPILLVFLFLRHKKTLLSKKLKNIFFVSLLIGLFLLLPTLTISLTPGFSARAFGLNLFKKFGIFTSVNEIASLYTSYFSPRFMFSIGDYDQKMLIPELSTFYTWQFPFYIYGLYLIYKLKRNEFKYLILLLFIISPIPASITRDPYSTIRSFPLIVPQLTIISLGVAKIFNFSKNIYTIKVNSKYQKMFSAFVVIGIIGFSLLKLKSSFFVLFPYHKAKFWNYGYQELSDSIGSINNDQLIVLDNTRLTEPYIELLFFMNYNPQKYQSNNQEVALNSYYQDLNRNNNKTIENIIIKPIDWKGDIKKADFLIGDNLSISNNQIREHHLTLIREIYYLNGEVAFKIVKTD